MAVDLLGSGKFFEQFGYIEKLKDLVLLRAKGDTPLAFVKTYGCQQNVSDGEKIKGMLFEMGYEFTDEEEKADLILFNTCAIRENAENRVFGNVGALKALKKSHPGMIIALCGCMMEQEHVAEKIKESFPFVDLVFGTHSLQDFPRLLYRTFTEPHRIFEKAEGGDTVVEGIPIKRDQTIKAWLPIMYGCDNFCSYCVVPYVRGRERSRRPESVLKEATELIASGYKDITLLGQNVNSYGRKLQEAVDFPRLLQKIDEIDGDYWLRFTTSHPKDATKALIDTMAHSKHICHQLHLPVQCGSNRILGLMNRKYTKEKYLEIINYAKEKMPDISITSDIIVGFPGETYEDFCETLELIKAVGFSSLFTFIYSKRPGTPAAKMDDPVPEKEKSAWFQELLKVQEGMSAAFCAKMQGKTFRVLVEGITADAKRLLARTPGNIIVELEGEKSLIGSFIDVKIIKTKTWVAMGEIVSED